VRNKVILFAIPYAGGSMYSFNILKKYCPDFIDFCPIELPGHGARINDSLRSDIHEIVEDLYSQIERRITVPYAFFGHSMGSIIIYLLAKKITSFKKPLPSQLFVSGKAGPSTKSLTKRHLFSDEELKEEIKKLGGTAKEVIENEDLINYFIPIIRADFQALETYKHSNSLRLNVPITVLVGEDDNLNMKDVLSWQEESIYPIKLIKLTGGHFFINDHPKRIMDLLKDTLSPLAS